MSDIVQSFARKKLASLPPEPPLTEDAEDDPYSSASSVSSTGTVRPTNTSRKKAMAAKLTASGWQPTFEGTISEQNRMWSDFFQQELYLDHKTDTHIAQYHVYIVEPKDAQQPIIVLHHGAGSSALTFALFVEDLRRLLPNVGILAVDAREHGESVVRDAKTGKVDTDLSIDSLTSDFSRMVRLASKKMGWGKTVEDGELELPSLLLVGHSMGGAVVTHAANIAALGNKSKSGKRMNTNLIGFTVIDVVEGSAVDALKHMKAYLANKPSSFDSVEDAIDWHMRSKTLRNIDSAKVSVPSLLVPDTEDEDKLLWRTDLSRTEDFWWNWFEGMSKKFLSSTGAKLLILAGTDRLDKDLMIGQMQGKFQLQVLPEAGHFVQEDSPEKTANLVAEFLKRNDRSALVLPPKVSDMIAQGLKV